MSSSARSGRIIRAATHQEEVFVLGETRRETVPLAAPFATAAEVLAAAERRAEELLADARANAAALVAQAEVQAAAVRDAAYADGLGAGRAEATAEVQRCIDLARQAADEGKSVRDDIAGQYAAVIARAVALATRRIVGEYYEADPTRTAIACAEALRAAAGQQVLAIRVHPGVVGAVQASLVDAAQYVRPDAGMEIGGCIIDLAHGTLDATLDARLSLMELALTEAGGEGLQ